MAFQAIMDGAAAHDLWCSSTMTRGCRWLTGSSIWSINSHEFYDVQEISRVLQMGGSFLTQQIGGQDLAELNVALGAPPLSFADWNLDYATPELRDAGFTISTAAEALITTTFAEIGAVVAFVQADGWQIPGFTIADYQPQLHRWHERIRREGPFVAHSHRILLHGTTP